MPKQRSVEFTERAQAAYDRLPKAEQDKIMTVLQGLLRVGLRLRGVKRVSGQEGVYLCRVSSRIRMILQVQDEVITVLDIAAHIQLERILRYWSEE